ncbi:gelsolin-like protein 1 isoform X3 [Saccostrea cucullata]|uniref:gelsolin-like protein 1 isoform X3 n=1 Tax=Saccostrea cuccullata TaxID=36930 RepID=UPI002ED48902
MSGLTKAKQYDWKDSNLALFGSDTEKQVKKESAESEPAWKGIGQKAGLQIWRIVKFKVTSWPKEDYGKFYNGDSYIVLNTYKDDSSDELLYDVHFWIGKYSTQDEYGTAAYKTVELDTFLDDKPIQHREVQGFESDLFKSYFDTITILEGGAETGFNKVTPEKYTPRLFHFCGTRKNVEVKQVPRSASRLDSGDVFILDLGLTIYQWNGKGSNKDERMKAMQYLIALKDERRGKAKSEVLEEEGLSKSHEFYHALNPFTARVLPCPYPFYIKSFTMPLSPFQYEFYHALIPFTSSVLPCPYAFYSISFTMPLSFLQYEFYNALIPFTSSV